MQQQKLCLKWNNHTVNLLSELQSYQQKDVLVDVTISCEGRNIKAHKMILSACSPYFQSIFSENPCQHPIVIINGMKYEDITSILNFMYKGEVNVSHDGLSSFLQAAEALKVKGLAEVCGEKKSATANSQESESTDQVRPPQTDTPTKKRHRNRKRSISDDESAATSRKQHKEPNSPEIHELSGDEAYVGDMSSNGQSVNSRVSHNVYSRPHQSSSVISHVDEMDDDYEIEPSKLLEQTLTTENVSMNNTSSDNSLRIERIMGNATDMDSSNLQEPESPPDIKPLIEYGESSAGTSDGTMVVYNEQSQPGPSSVQDSSLVHDNSPTQAALASQIFKFLADMKNEVRDLKTTVQNMKPGPSSGPPSLPKSCPQFPLTTHEELKIFDSYLANKEVFNQIVSYYHGLCGTGVIKKTVHKILSKIIAHDLALRLNWKGRGEKSAFCDFQNIHDFIYYTSTMNAKDADGHTLQMSNDIIKNYLRFAPDRNGGRLSRSIITDFKFF